MRNSFKTYSVIEASVIEKITKNKKVTRQELIKDIKVSESSIDIIINKLLSNNVIKLCDDSTYQYVQPLTDDIIILDGQLLLPVAVIDEGDTVIISRGSKWYRFRKEEFDIRRIIWNVDMVDNNGNSNNQTLVDLLKSTITKEPKKSTITQSAEYLNLVNKIIPYNKDIGIHMLKIGDELTECNIIFKINMSDGIIEYDFKGFSSHNTLSTIEIMSEINKSTDERNYQNIHIDREIDIRDIIFKGNAIPIGFCDSKSNLLPTKTLSGSFLKILKIKEIKNKLVVEFGMLSNLGILTITNEESYDSISEGIESILNITKPFVDLLLRKNDFHIDVE